LAIRIDDGGLVALRWHSSTSLRIPADGSRLATRRSPLVTILARFHAQGFRTLHDVVVEPGRMCALVGEANAGKSNLLAAIRAVLDPAAAPLRDDDTAVGGPGTLRLRADLAAGTVLTVDGPPPGRAAVRGGEAPPVLFLPAALRSDGVVAPSAGTGQEPSAAELALCGAIDAHPGAHSTTEPAHSLVAGLEACRDGGIGGVVYLIEEPELYLPPQTGRYLYRLLADVASRGNQVVYSTHSPAFLNVTHLDDLVLTERHPERGTLVVQPGPLDADELLRASSEFDAERSELFLARAVVLVEGITEKLILPFVFRALGHDADRERISIVECGGKSKMPLFIRICLATGVPFVAVHDRDAEAGEEPNPGERHLNDLIASIAGPGRTVVLEPDFERVAGLRSRRDDKVARAWHHFRGQNADEVPEPLARVVDLARQLAG
jgi:hypothetical protein